MTSCGKRFRISSPSQLALDFGACCPPHAPEAQPRSDVLRGGGGERKLDAEGHRYWAGLCRGKQEDLIAKAQEWPEHGQALATVAKQWAEQAAGHQARAFVLEPESRME